MRFRGVGNEEGSEEVGEGVKSVHFLCSRN